jgi:hypothetical protein
MEEALDENVGFRMAEEALEREFTEATEEPEAAGETVLTRERDLVDCFVNL